MLIFQVHNSIKPFSCTFCDSKFARVSHLNRHIRTHTGERPFPCNLCEKSFARQDKLKVHMDRHNKEGGIMPPQAKKPKKIQTDRPPPTTKVEPVSAPQMTGPDPMSAYNPNSLWNGLNGFGMYETGGYPHQPVYPGMVNPGYMPPLQNVMRIGECSVKPVGQWGLVRACTNMTGPDRTQRAPLISHVQTTWLKIELQDNF